MLEFIFKFSEIYREISERCRQITVIWQSLPILSKVLILVRWTITIPLLFALTFSALLTLVFVIPGLILFYRWFGILGADEFNTGDMKVPTFYSTKEGEEGIGYIFFMPAVGVVYTVQDGSSPFPPVTKLYSGGYPRRFLLVSPFYYLYSLFSWPP